MILKLKPKLLINNNMKFILLFILINVYIINVQTMRFSNKKKFLFKNKKNNKSHIKNQLNNNLSDDYEIPKWVYSKVFKYNKNNIYNETKY